MPVSPLKKIFSFTGARLLAVGLASVFLGWFVGGAANARGANGQLIGIATMQLVIILAFFNVHHIGLPSLRWRKGCLCTGLIAGVATSLVVGALYYLLTLSGLQMPEQASIEYLRLATGPQLALMVMLSVFGAALAEEIFFRGWLLEYLRCRMSAGKAILSTALIFALIHGSLAALPGLLILGIVLGLVAVRWGVMSAILGHMIFNLITVVAVRGGWV